MNEKIQKNKFYKIKAKISNNNKNLINRYQPKNKKILKKIETNLLNLKDISGRNNIDSFIKSFQTQISDRKKTIESPIKNNNNSQFNINKNSSNNLNDEKVLFERPKIRIKLTTDTINNNHTISSEKSNKSIQYKVHKIKPKKLNYLTKSNFSPNKSLKKAYTKSTNYNLINSIQNNYNLSKMNINKISKENSITNFYYNKIQEKHLENLNNNIENLIKEQSMLTSTYPSELTSTRNNTHYYQNKTINNNKKKIKMESDFNKTDFMKKNSRILNWKKIVYKKKLRINENDYNKTFSKKYLLNSDKFKLNNNMFFDNDINKIDLKKKLITGTLNNFKSLALFEKKKLSPFKSDINNNTEAKKIPYTKKNSSILFPSFLLKEENNNNHKNNFQHKNNYTKSENNNTIKELLLNIKENNETINYIKEKNSKEKDLKNIDSYNSIKKYYTIVRHKKKLNFNSPKFNRNRLINSIISNKDILSNSEKLENKIIEKCQSNINYYINNNWNNNISNNYLFECSNNVKPCTTLNTIDTSENDIIQYFNNRIDIKPNPNMTISEQFSFPRYYYSFKPKKIISKDVLDKKKLTLNNSKSKKLKNVITSIEYKNKNNNEIIGNNLDDKRLIISEDRNDGKVNVKIMEMKASIEKIIKEKSFCLSSPRYPRDTLTYIKKNQGTHISKIKKHDSIY